MSAYTSAYLCCDGRIPHPDAPLGILCPAKVEGGQQPDGTWVFPATRAEARKLARARGWTIVRHPRARTLDKDFCPEHCGLTSA